jgi:5-methyltetrahydrofolate--homocysteine methyltransferase
MAAVKQHDAPLVGLSTFLTTTMPMARLVIDALAKEGLRERVRVMVGGAPVTQEYADTIGADGYAPDANATVRLARRLLVAMGLDAGADEPPVAATVAEIGR